MANFSFLGELLVLSVAFWSESHWLCSHSSRIQLSVLFEVLNNLLIKGYQCQILKEGSVQS